MEINNQNLAGKSFCITGTLSHSRKRYVNFIKEHGGRFVREVSGKVDYVLRGECCGQKEDKADDLGLSFISENDLYRMAGATLC